MTDVTRAPRQPTSLACDGEVRDPPCRGRLGLRRPEAWRLSLASKGSSVARIVVIGNAGGGKSTLSRAIASARHLPHPEVDRWLWRPGWQPTPKLSYDADHAKAIAGDAWVIDGLGRQESIAPRFARATAIVLVDMPLWTHYWLAAERQIALAKCEVRQPPGAIDTMPPTEALFRTMWEVDQGWMPMVRELCRRSERSGATLYRLGTIAALNGFADHFAQHHPPTPAFRPAGAH